MPTLAVTLAYVRACDGDLVEWERTWRETALELGVVENCTAADVAERAPYAGLAAFQTDDAQWFFGRERLVSELVELVGRQRFVAVIGASGSGKSSLLRAGLAGAAATSGGLHPGAASAGGVCDPARCAGGWYAGPVVRGVGQRSGEPAPRAASGAGSRAGAERHRAHNRQFEETYTQGAQEGDAFVQALVTAARAPHSRCRVVLGVRADFYAHCTRHPDLLEALRDAQVPVGPMDLDELRSAIVQPATRAGLIVEGALLATLTGQAHGQPGVLPLLSHAMLETWRRRRGNALTLDALRASGGLEGALARTAESFHDALTSAQRDVARRVFTRLTSLGEGTEDTRRRITTRELDLTPDTAVVLERAAAARLLVLDRDLVVARSPEDRAGSIGNGASPRADRVRKVRAARKRARRAAPVTWTTRPGAEDRGRKWRMRRAGPGRTASGWRRWTGGFGPSRGWSSPC